MAARLGAQQWKTPPDSIGHLRQLFDEHVELRTAYYSLGNYIAAIEVQELLKIAPVVMDRYSLIIFFILLYNSGFRISE